MPKKIERGPFSLVRFCMLRLKSEKRKGRPFPITWMRIPGNRLVEQIEQKSKLSQEKKRKKLSVTVEFSY